MCPGLLILFSVIFTFYSICDDGFAENSNFNAFHLSIYLWPNEPVHSLLPPPPPSRALKEYIPTKLFSTYRIRIATLFSYFYLFILFFSSSVVAVAAVAAVAVVVGFHLISLPFAWFGLVRCFGPFIPLIFNHSTFPFYSKRAQLLAVRCCIFSLLGHRHKPKWNWVEILRICKDAYYYFYAKKRAILEFHFGVLGSRTLEPANKRKNRASTYTQSKHRIYTDMFALHHLHNIVMKR